MAQAEISRTINAPKDVVYKVITDYEKYPEFVSSCQEAKVLSSEPGKKRVAYRVELMKDVRYTVDQREDAAKGVVEWSLVESNIFKQNAGRWELREVDATHTEATYTLEVEFKIPVPGFVLKKLVQGSLPAMVKDFVERAESLG